MQQYDRGYSEGKKNIVNTVGIYVIYSQPRYISTPMLIITTLIEQFISVAIANWIVAAFRPLIYTNEPISTWRYTDSFLRFFVTTALSNILVCRYFLVLGRLHTTVVTFVSALLCIWAALDTMSTLLVEQGQTL